MNDRELLELVAKAAGYDTQNNINDQRRELGIDFAKVGFCVVDANGTACTAWNPLKNDSEKWRLARQLKMTVNFEYKTVDAPLYNASGLFLRTHTECWESDEGRAIVRAAAEVGRAMEGRQ